MTNTSQCPDCGTELPSSGLCTRCLLKVGMEQPALQVRCPHCRNPIEVVHDTPLANITCPSCDSKFSLLGDRTVTHLGREPRTIGHFELLENIGTGGFGSVWKAHDRELDRSVAVKIPRSGQLSPVETDQFLREARAVAQLKHPNIVGVHEVGRDGDTIYIVSDFVNGITVADWLTAQHATPLEAAQLCAKVAEALHHAHEAGVVHRDLKPSNIMLESIQSRTGSVTESLNPETPSLEFVPHIMDFGLAKREAGEITMTVEGKVLGTPAYMSPEQARGEAHHADARSDVYSLGVILFELLTGEKPFRGSIRMLLHQVLHDDAPSPRQLNSQVPRDLETICLKAMAKEPPRRYATARAMAHDLRRWLNGEPIHGRPIGRLERSWRWCKRKPAAAGLVVVTVALLVVAAVGGTYLALRERATAEKERSLRDLAERSADESHRRLVGRYVASGQRLVEEGQLMASLPWFAEALRLDQGDRQREQPHRLRLATVLQRCPKLVRFWVGETNVTDSEFSPDGRQVAVVTNHDLGEDRYQSEIRVWEVATGQPIGPVIKEAAFTYTARFSPDGRRLVTAAADNKARVREVATGAAVFPSLKHDGEVESAAFSPDGERIVTVACSFVGHHYAFVQTRLWNALTGQPVGTPLKDKSLFDVAETRIPVSFTRDGRYTLIPFNGDKTVQLYDAATGRAAGPPIQPSSSLQYAALSPNGGHIAIATSDGSVSILDAGAGTLALSLRLPGHGASMSRVLFSPDGDWLLTLSSAEARVWDTSSGKPVGPPWVYRDAEMAEGRWVRSKYLQGADAQFGPDGRHVLTRHGSVVSVWDGFTARRVSPPFEHVEQATLASFSPDGHRIVTAEGKVVRVWDLVTSGPLQMTARGDLRVVALSPDASRFATARADEGRAEVWDARTAEPVGPALQHPYVWHVAFNADGTRLLTKSDSGRLWDARSLVPITPAFKAKWASFSPDGRRLLFDSGNEKSSTIELIDAVSGKPLRKPRPYPGCLDRAMFSPDGRRALVCGEDGAGLAEVLNLDSGHITKLPSKFGRLRDACFDQSGRLLVVTAHDGAEVWNTDTGDRVGAPIAHEGIWRGQLSPDARLVVTASEGGTIRVYDVASRKLVGGDIRHRADSGFVGFSVVFSPEGRRLLTSGSDGARVWDVDTGDPISPPLKGHAYTWTSDGRYVLTATAEEAWLWDAATGQAVTPPLRHEGRTDVTFTPNVRHVITEGREGRIRLWNLVPDPRSVEDLLSISELLSFHHIDPTGGCTPLELAKLQRNWKTLSTKYPEQFRRRTHEVVGWHRRWSEDCQQARQWSRAIWHSNRLIPAADQQWRYHAARGFSYGSVGRNGEAAADYARAVGLGSDDEHVWYKHALLRLSTSDLNGYQQACADLLARLGTGDHPPTAAIVAWTCVMAPDAGVNPTRALELAQQAVIQDPKQFRYLRTLGAALYRSGKSDAAVQRLKEAIALQKDAPSTWLFLAMAYHGLGQDDQARRWLNQTITWIGQEQPGAAPGASFSKLPWDERLLLRLARDEAETLMKEKGSK